MKKLLLVLFLIVCANAFGQPWYKTLSIGGNSLATSSIFQINSTTKGAINAPKMTTTQMNAITSLVEGLEVWDTVVKSKAAYDGTAWVYPVYASNSQVLTNKNIDADNNTITNIDNNEIKAGAAIDRSKLAAGTANHVVINGVSGAFSSEATLAKTRGGSGQDNSSVTFPASGTLVTETGAQPLTNKDVDIGTASNSKRITVGKDTKANLDALTRKEATIVYASDTKKFYGDNGTLLGDLGGGGGGGLDTVYTENFEGDVATAQLSSGNNATVLGGGSLAGTLADDTTTPLDKLKSIKFTQAAGSLNDYFCSPVLSLYRKPRNNYLGANFYYKYDGATNDIGFIIYDVTNSQILTSSLDLLSAASESTRYSTAVFVPSSTTQIRWCFQVKVLNSTKILTFDDIELSLDPFKYKNLTNNTEITDGGTITIQAVSSNPTKGTVVEDKILWAREGAKLWANYKYEQSSAGTIGSGDYLFTLPNGLSFDSNYVTFYTGVLNQTANSQQMSRSVVGTGTASMSIGSGYNGILQLVAYDATRFRVFGVQGNGATGAAAFTRISSAVNDFTLDYTRMAYNFILNAPISGWRAVSENLVTPQYGAENSITLYGANGYGSTATKIRRYTTTRNNLGSAVSCPDSATNGTICTINTSGNYTITTSETVGSISTIGITINTADVTDNLSSRPESEVLAKETSAGSGYSQSASWTGYLNKGDLIRPHNNGSSSTYASFSITREGYKALSAVKSSVGQVVNVYDEKDAGANGGGCTAGSWLDRDLTTLDYSLGSELVTNGEFTSDISGWTVGANNSWVSGTLQQSYSGGGGSAAQAVAVTNGKKYIFRAKSRMISGTGNTTIRVYDGTNNSGTLLISKTNSSTSWVEEVVAFTAISGNVFIQLYNAGDPVTMQYDDISVKLKTFNNPEFISLASNIITLTSGKYKLTGVVPAIGVAKHKARLYNNSDSTIVASGMGMSVTSDTSVNSTTFSKIESIFEISTSKDFKIQHQCETTKATTGFGAASNFGEVERYTTLSITKLE